jgi:hypothetical protein
MKFSFEKPTIRLYRFYFLGISTPLTIQAYNEKEARIAVDKIWNRLSKEYQVSRIIGQTVSVPIFGVSKRKEGDKTLVWVGKGFSKTGWMDIEVFKKKYESL